MTTPFTMDANAFLMGSGTPAAQFPTVGTTVGGTITQPPKVEQQKDLDTGEPKFWNDGQPMMQLVVTVQTEQRDPGIVDDDGQRTFYIKANSLKAVRDAVRRSGAKGLEVGGTLALTYTGDGEVRKRGHNPPKFYSATYAPAAAAAANAFLNQGAPQAPAPAPQYAAPVAQPAYVPPAPAAPAPQYAAPVAQPAYVPPAPVAQPQPQPQPQAPAPAAWTAPPGTSPEQAAALAQLTPEQRATLGFA